MTDAIAQLARANVAAARSREPKPLSESDWQDQVIDLAHLYGWRVAHFRPARTAQGWRTPVQADGAGFPDLVMTRGPRCVIAELKAQKGRLSDDQKLWLQDFVQAGLEAYVWRPADFDEVQEVLR